MKDQEPIEAYLDDMFDRLAGTGAAGRRMLTETEDHLRSATEDATSRGLDPVAAQVEALTRFGPPPAVGTPVKRVARVAAAGWALLGACIALISATFIVHGVISVINYGMGVPPVCGTPEAMTAATCVQVESGWVPKFLLDQAAELATVVLGALMALPWLILRRRPRPVRWLFACTGVALVAVVALRMNTGGYPVRGGLVLATVILLGCAVLVERRSALYSIDPRRHRPG